MSQRKMLVTGIIFLTLILTPTVAMAQDVPPVSVTPTIDCGEVVFHVEINEGTAPYTLYWDFGDEESMTETDVSSTGHETSHSYPGAGDYTWSLSVVDSAEIETGVVSGSLSIGPSVSLSAGMMPPIFELGAGTVTVDFTAETSGGKPPYVYEWSFAGATDFTSDPASNMASATYASGGKFEASVTVTDACPLSQTATLTILVNDPEADACHPMAQRIATAVSWLFPTQAEALYTCEDIFAIFEGSLSPGSHFGFGRLWHAYKLSEQIADLTWEEILGWKIDGSGWGVLLQLNRFADALEEVGIGELIAYVQDGVYSVNDIRTTLRSVLRYDAEFQEALDMLAAGASPGQVGQYFRLVQDLELDPALLDELLESGASLTELRHAAKLAEQAGGDIGLVTDAHVAGYSWGEIKQAYRLADEDLTVEMILEQTVSEVRREERESEHNARTAAQIASRYGVEAEDVIGVYEGECSFDWSCVRAHFRDLEGKPSKGKKDK